MPGHSCKGESCESLHRFIDGLNKYIKDVHHKIATLDCHISILDLGIV